MKFWPCWPHSWGKWETVAKGTIASGGRVIGHYQQQRRECSLCGKAELRQEMCYADN